MDKLVAYSPLPLRHGSYPMELFRVGLKHALFRAITRSSWKYHMGTFPDVIKLRAHAHGSQNVVLLVVSSAKSDSGGQIRGIGSKRLLRVIRIEHTIGRASHAWSTWIIVYRDDGNPISRLARAALRPMTCTTLLRRCVILHAYSTRNLYTYRRLILTSRRA